MEPVVLPLSGWVGLRTRCLIHGLGLAGLVALAAVGAWMTASLFGAFLGSSPGLGDLAMLIVLLAPLGAWGFAFAAPAFGPRPALEVAGDGFILRYPGLGRPLVVPRSEVEVAAVDAVPPRHVLPTLTLQVFDRPNLAIRFRVPQATVAPPLWVRIGLDKMFVGGRTVEGMLLAVDDPATAAYAFSRWERLGRVDPGDPALVTPEVPGRRALLIVAALVGMIVIRHLL